jgi:hypothetical protein
VDNVEKEIALWKDGQDIDGTGQTILRAAPIKA